jgi:hypothetical protein
VGNNLVPKNSVTPLSQFAQGVVHKPSAEAEALAIATNRQQRQHGGGEQLTIRSTHTREKTTCAIRLVASSLSPSPKMQQPERNASRNAAVRSLSSERIINDLAC